MPGLTPPAGATIPKPALILGAAGLLPPLAALWLLVLGQDQLQAGAMFTAIFAYTALIFSFIGGSWWGFASRAEGGARWTDLLLAVAPSLAAFLCLPLVGSIGPQGALVLAALVLVSPVVDLRFQRGGLAPGWWMRLRVPLSGALALILAGAVWVMD